MSFSDHTFDRSALILAWLSQRENSNAHEDLRSYHKAVSAAFSKAFGVDLDAVPQTVQMADDDGLKKLFLDTVRSYEAVRSPFSSHLCGTREISEIYQKHGDSLNEAASALRDCHVLMMVELIERIWGDGVPHTVTGKKLEACGHPGQDAPDPSDYW